MNFSLNIIQKIWLSLSVLIAGYLTSMLLGFASGQVTETRLNDISEYLFPITIQSNKALQKFNEQVKSYNDAIMISEISVLESAEKNSLEVIKAFKTILSYGWLSKERHIEIQNIKNLFEDYSNEANFVYSKMCTNGSGSMNISDELTDRAFTLSKKTHELKEKIDSLSKIFENDLKTELKKIIKNTKKQRLMNLIVFVCVVSISISFSCFIITRSIKEPLKNTLSMLKDIAEGDGNLKARLSIKNKDEIGELAEWFNIFVENIQNIIKQIAENAVFLNKSSSSLQNYSEEMTTDVKQLTDYSENVLNSKDQLTNNINNIAASAEELSMNINSVSSTAEQMANNMNFVAESTESMNISINNIGKSVKEGQEISAQAMELAKNASLNMNLLGSAAREIGQVTVAIKRIAVQTNLLSLNASIEASTAGESGSGFAVVAQKIKQFASQSTQSAENIAKKIEDVQSKTENAINVIEKVTEIIERINKSNSYIKSTVEKQMQKTSDISLNISELNKGTKLIASAIGESALGINEMSENTGYAAVKTKKFSEIIDFFRITANKSNESAVKVENAAFELTEIASKLNKMVGKFII